MVELLLKFNSGQGALLCSCLKIMAYGFEHHDKTYSCDCGKTFKVRKRYVGDDIYRYEATEI